MNELERYEIWRELQKHTYPFTQIFAGVRSFPEAKT